jgi:hypothetical protein
VNPYASREDSLSFQLDQIDLKISLARYKPLLTYAMETIHTSAIQALHSSSSSLELLHPSAL